MSDLDVEMKLKLIDEASKPAKNANKELKKLDDAAKKVGKNSSVGKLAEDLNNVDKKTIEASASLDKLARISGKNGFKTLSKAAGIGSLSLAGLGSAILLNTRNSIEWERSLYNVQRTARVTGPALNQLEKSIFKTSRATGIGKNELSDAMKIAAEARRPVYDLARFTEYAAKTSLIWGTSSEQNAERLARLATIYKLNQNDIEKLGDAIETTAHKSSSNQTDLMEFLDKSGKIAVEFNVGANSVLAWGAALRDTGLETTDSVKVLENFTKKLGNASKGGKDFQKSLKQIGLNAKTVERAMQVDPSKALFNILERISKTKNPLQTLKDVFGDQAGLFAPLLQKFNTLKETFNDVSDAGNKAGGAVAESVKVFQSQNFNKIEKATRTLDEFGIKLGNIGTVSLAAAVEPLNNFMDRIDKNQTFFQLMFKYMDLSSQATKTAIQDEQGNEIRRNPAMLANRRLGLNHDRRVQESFEKSSSFSKWLFGGDTEEEIEKNYYKSVRDKQYASDMATINRFQQISKSKEMLERQAKFGGSHMERASARSQLSGLPELEKQAPVIMKRLQNELERTAASMSMNDDILTRIGLKVPSNANPFLFNADDSAQTSMEKFNQVILTEGGTAKTIAGQIASDIKNALSFDAKISITPTLSAPGVSAPVSTMPKPSGQHASNSARPITIGSVNVHGVKDLAGLQRQITNVADARVRNTRDGALHDLGSLT